jgi:SpoU rRNA methylase family enzyme
MSAAIDGLNEVHRIKPSSYNMQVLFYSKSDEIVNVYSPRVLAEKKKVADTCKILDPGNISKYDRILQ